MTAARVSPWRSSPREWRFPATPALCQGAIDPEAMETRRAGRARVSGDLFRLIAPVLLQYPQRGDDACAMVYYRNRMKNRLGASPGTMTDEIYGD